MAKKFIEESTLSAIGNSIRAKTGKTNKIPPLNMPTEISNIQTSGTEPYVEETYDSSGNITKAKFVGHTLIRDSAFISCNTIKSVNLPSGITSIGANAFRGCTKLVLTSLPSGITSIGADAFSGCTGLSSITIPNSVKCIGISVFSGCTGLTSITILDSIASIKAYAFYDCKSLTNIIFQGTKAQWEAIEKGTSWDSGTGSYIVHCTDGDIPKNES